MTNKQKLHPTLVEWSLILDFVFSFHFSKVCFQFSGVFKATAVFHYEDCFGSVGLNCREKFIPVNGALPYGQMVVTIAIVVVNVEGK